MKFKMTWSRYGRLAAFSSGAALTAAPYSFLTFIETGKVWFVWQGAFLLSVFWVMLYLSHRWAHKKGER